MASRRFSRKVNAVIQAGAAALVEQGRREIRQQLREQKEHEVRVAERGIASADDAVRVGLPFLLMECASKAHRTLSAHTMRDNQAGVFACALSGLTRVEMDELLEVAQRAMRASSARYLRGHKD